MQKSQPKSSPFTNGGSHGTGTYLVLFFSWKVILSISHDSDVEFPAVTGREESLNHVSRGLPVNVNNSLQKYKLFLQGLKPKSVVLEMGIPLNGDTFFDILKFE